MDKKDYFKLAMDKDLYVERSWILRAFGTPTKPVKDTRPYALNFDGTTHYFHQEDGERVDIEGRGEGLPLFTRTESVVLEKGYLKNIEEDTRTSFLTALINQIIFVWPFKNPLPYIAQRFSKKELKKAIIKAKDEGTITLDEYIGPFTQAMGRLTALTQICVVAATPKSIRPSKAALEFRDMMLEAATEEDKQDPAWLAELDTKVSQIDREELKGDPSELFFLKGKQYDTVRKKMFHVQGGLPRMDDPTKMDLLPTSLDEGLRLEDFPAMVNNLRSGSYSRAKETALGGEAAKFASRVFQNFKIDEDDCGSVVGLPVPIEEGRENLYLGRYIVGEDVPLDEERLKGMVGKTIIIRDPFACKTPNRNVCGRCMGDSTSSAGIGLGAQYVEVSNVFMSEALAVFHAGSLKVTRAELSRHLR